MASTESDYDYLRQVVMCESANRIDASRNTTFESRLAEVASQAGASTLGDLVSILRAEERPQLQRAVAEAMTINETSFFRDGLPFDVMREVILPRLIQKNACTRRLRIWSAASSTGQEAYSAAMTILESFPELETWDVKILGTDISRQVVEYATRGRYRRLEVNRGLRARMLVKYFVRDEEEWEIVPRARAMCEFRCMNLCSPMRGLPTFDIVLLRNALLHFAPRDRGRVFEEVHRQMSPEGYLLLGASEQAEDSTELFEAEFANDCYFYRPVAT